MQIACKTDVGKTRSHNEDCCYAGENFAIVADGMGGHNKGEVASSMTVDILKELLDKKDKKCCADLLISAIQSANRKVYAKSVSGSEYAGMGTTVVSCIWDEKKIILGYIGDSRCYEIGKSGIRLLTKDHTLVQKLKDEGKLTEEQAKDYPDKHMITRAVGTDPEEIPDIVELKRKKNQWLILCSDGLSNYVSEDEMLACVEEKADPEQVAAQLVEMANTGGGLDNITAVVIQF